jgi:hypothetical protein
MAAPWQLSVTLIGALAAAVQVPGPSSGITATSTRALSCPLSSPFATFSALALAIELALESVTLEESAPRCPLVVGAVGTVRRLVALATVLVGDIFVVAVGFFRRGAATRWRTVVVVVVTVVGRVVAKVVVVESAVSSVAFEGVDVVKVKTRTSSSRGLDHITQCVLLSERSDLIEVLEG